LSGAISRRRTGAHDFRAPRREYRGEGVYIALSMFFLMSPHPNLLPEGEGKDFFSNLAGAGIFIFLSNNASSKNPGGNTRTAFDAR
jgi:hypothetical protein